MSGASLYILRCADDAIISQHCAKRHRKSEWLNTAAAIMADTLRSVGQLNWSSRSISRSSRMPSVLNGKSKAGHALKEKALISADWDRVRLLSRWRRPRPARRARLGGGSSS